MLRQGGSAVDAAVAAGFAAAVAEPGLSSLGGGGFLLVRTPDGSEHLLDFFVDAPGSGLVGADTEPHFVAVPVRFAGAVQEFHAGWGSVAVPGCFDGYLTAHRRWGRLPLAAVVEPARRMALDGVVLDPAQAALLEMLEQIFSMSPDGRAVVAPRGRLLRAGDRVRNPLLGEFLGGVAAGRLGGFADPAVAGPLTEAMRAGGGLLTPYDLQRYRVVERSPLVGSYAGTRLATNPAPSFGGGLVVWALGELDRAAGAARAPGTGGADVAVLAEVLVRMSQRHRGLAAGTLAEPTVTDTALECSAAGGGAQAGPGPLTSRGTTHVSAVDADGGVAAMTTSNGSCSGCFVPGTGIQLNNVMGELDLHPGGFHSTPPGVRIGSMMAPTVVITADGGVVGLGSGGSERIRSALACVLHDLVAGGMPLADAVLAPRMHWDRERLQVEPGLDEEALRRLEDRWPVNTWPARDLYFGGVHAVRRAPSGEVAA
ncbi:MAG: gamma-glutamyltransferase, partial [Actinomycetota bacterium]|nr:gamma-glutamyltransferase [Actinomycetota bacterium]